MVCLQLVDFFFSLRFQLSTIHGYNYFSQRISKMFILFAILRAGHFKMLENYKKHPSLL